jgi:hypothetical protein
MKKFAFAALALCAATASFGQVKAQSIDIEQTSSALSLNYVSDGLHGFAAINIKTLGFNNVFGVKGLSLSTLVVNPRIDTTKDSYVGALLNYTYTMKNGWGLEFGLGAKGLDVTSLVTSGNFSNFNFGAGRQALISVGITIPTKF